MAKWDGVDWAARNWRFNPFTEATNYQTLASWEYTDIYGGVSFHRVANGDFGYVIKAREAIGGAFGDTTLEYATIPLIGPWTAGTEVNDTPNAIGEYRADYSYDTGLIKFDSSMNGKYCRIKYTRKGSNIDADVWNYVLKQQAQYGHDWMHFTSESFSVVNQAAGTTGTFKWYEAGATNDPYGKYAHWPVMKCQLTGGGNIAAWANLTFRPLYGGLTHPPTNYEYIGGVFWISDALIGAPFDAYLLIYYHGETPTKYVHVFLDGEDVVGCVLHHGKDPDGMIGGIKGDRVISWDLKQKVEIFKEIPEMAGKGPQQIYDGLLAEHVTSRFKVHGGELVLND